jgi:6-phosphogluconolactonase/glucosamine-6-phosphate isomerase/deaminase
VINSSEHIALVCGAGKAGVVESAVGNSQNSDANASKLQDLHVLADPVQVYTI